MHSETCVTVSGMSHTDLLPSLSPGARILFIRLRSLGDTVLSTPLYAALKAWRPDLSIAVLVESPNGEVLGHNPNVDQVISIHDGAGAAGRFLSRAAALRTIQAAGFDCCINLHGGSTSAWFAALCGSRHRVGLKSFRHAFAYTHQLDVPARTSGGAKWHTVEYQVEWLRRLGLPETEIPPLSVVPAPELEAPVKNQLLELGLRPDARYVVIQPTSKFFTKEWTAEGFAEVASYLVTKHGVQVLLSGGPGEEPKLRSVARYCKERVLVVGGLSIAELLWVFRGACLFIGNDSGPTHLAAALRIPIVVLFGSSDAEVWSPWKVPFQRVQNPFDCNPCPGYRCLV
ncbi:MAG: glycosyltransferase family 9 protein, partial [Acidobacteria bacterium]|nr:glycosyltransferase family 9 protein [Acidobacteriota bacterium]